MSMKIAAVQMVSGPRPDENLDRAEARVAEAAAQGAELVALPEYFCLMGLRDRDKLAIAEPDGDGPIQRRLAQIAARHRVWLVAGSLPLAVPGDADHATNTTLVFDPEGRRAGRYDKIHLFRFDDGERRHDEAATLRAGHAPLALDITARDGRAHRTGVTICYDLRFPELYRQLATPPCDLMVVTAAFTWPTGQAHWELLLRARAVENQCWLLASAQGGLHENGRRTWGHSMVIDPWGQIVAELPEGEGVVVATLDDQRTAEIPPHVRIVAASIEPEEGAKTRRRRGSIRQGIQGPGGGEAAATGECPGGAGIRRSGREHFNAGAVAGRRAGIGERRRAAPGVDGCSATAGGDCNGIAGRDGEVGVVPRAGGVSAG
ncbi:Predicted amidohydrolase, partial [Sphaerotilus natans]